MKNFSKFLALYKKKFVCLELDNESQLAMTEWCRNNNFDISKNYSGEIVNNFDFHVTVFFSQSNHFLPSGVYDISPIGIDFKKFSLFGVNKDVAVLEIEKTPELIAYREFFEDHIKMKDSWGKWKPHMTISYEYRKFDQWNGDFPVGIRANKIKINDIEE